MKNNLSAHEHQLPIINNPSYPGMLVVDHVLTIIAALFLVLALLTFSLTAVTQLDVTIKAQVTNTFRCNVQEHNCVELHLSAAQAQQVGVNNPVRLEVAATGDYRRYTINGKVTSVEEGDNSSTPYRVIVELDPKNISTGVSPNFALIVVGSSSAWQLLKTKIVEAFK